MFVCTSVLTCTHWILPRPGTICLAQSWLCSINCKGKSTFVCCSRSKRCPSTKVHTTIVWIRQKPTVNNCIRNTALNINLTQYMANFLSAKNKHFLIKKSGTYSLRPTTFKEACMQTSLLIPVSCRTHWSLVHFRWKWESVAPFMKNKLICTICKQVAHVLKLSQKWHAFLYSVISYRQLQYPAWLTNAAWHISRPPAILHAGTNSVPKSKHMALITLINGFTSISVILKDNCPI